MSKRDCRNITFTNAITHTCSRTKIPFEQESKATVIECSGTLQPRPPFSRRGNNQHQRSKSKVTKSPIQQPSNFGEIFIGQPTGRERSGRSRGSTLWELRSCCRLGLAVSTQEFLTLGSSGWNLPRPAWGRGSMRTCS